MSYIYIYSIIRDNVTYESFRVLDYLQYTTEEGHRSVRKLWSFYYRFIALRCHNYALYLCFMYIYIYIAQNS